LNKKGVKSGGLVQRKASAFVLYRGCPGFIHLF